MKLNLFDSAGALQHFLYDYSNYYSNNIAILIWKNQIFWIMLVILLFLRL